MLPVELPNFTRLHTATRYVTRLRSAPAWLPDLFRFLIYLFTVRCARYLTHTFLTFYRLFAFTVTHAPHPAGCYYRVTLRATLRSRSTELRTPTLGSVTRSTSACTARTPHAHRVHRCSFHRYVAGYASTARFATTVPGFWTTGLPASLVHTRFTFRDAVLHTLRTRYTHTVTTPHSHTRFTHTAAPHAHRLLHGPHTGCLDHTHTVLLPVGLPPFGACYVTVLDTRYLLTRVPHARGFSPIRNHHHLTHTTPHTGRYVHRCHAGYTCVCLRAFSTPRLRATHRTYAFTQLPHLLLLRPTPYRLFPLRLPFVLYVHLHRYHTPLLRCVDLLWSLTVLLLFPLPALRYHYRLVLDLHYFTICLSHVPYRSTVRLRC